MSVVEHQENVCNSILKHISVIFRALQPLNHPSLPVVLGLAQQGPSFVFNTHLRTASEVIQAGTRIDKHGFISGIASALDTMHNNKLINIDLCLDSILVNDVSFQILCVRYALLFHVQFFF